MNPTDYIDINKAYHTKDCVRIKRGNTYAHELAKFNRAFQLINTGCHIMTEVPFQDDKGICDLLDLKEQRAYEFAKSEDEKSLLAKAKKYPIPFAIVRIKNG